MTKLTSLLLILAAAPVAAQSVTPPDSIIASAVAIYYQSQPNPYTLYSGKEFYGYPASIEGHAFFPENEWTTGTILYDDVWHYQVLLQYDAYMDEIRIKNATGTIITLYSGRVDEFTIGSRKFVRIAAGRNDQLKTGFYEQLGSGAAVGLVRHSKTLQEEVTSVKVERKFAYTSGYYIRKNGSYFSFKKQNDLLGLLRNSRANIAQELRQQGLSFRQEPLSYIQEAVNIYNRSTQ